MKIIKRIYINNEYRQLASNLMVLELSAGGRCALTVEGEVEQGALVTIKLGVDDNIAQWFTGYVTKSNPAESGYSRIMVRELCYLLNSPLSVSIQHATFKDVLLRLTELTKIKFVLPEDADYLKTQISNFTAAGTGYQILKDAGRAFAIPDFCWFQQTGPFVWCGSYEHSLWADKPVTIPVEVSDLSKGSNFLKTVVIPSLRPGVIVNNQRITKVTIEDDAMTLEWVPKQNQKTNTQRQIEQDYPELAAGFHLPKFGVVVAVADKAKAGQMNDPYRPRFAVDVQLLDENNAEDKAVPIYKALPLPVMFGGAEAGNLATPCEGTIVELGFAYGRPDKAFVRTVLGMNWTLPDIAPDEQLQQQRAEVFKRIGANGDQTDSTDQTKTEQAFIKHDEADRYFAEFGESNTEVLGNSIENIGGMKVIEALGTLNLLAGDNMELGAIGNMHIASGGELVQAIGKLRDVVVAQDDMLKIMGNRLETIEKDWEATAKNMRFTADLITMNGGKGVVQGDCICSFTGLPHSDLSATVKAGK
ncbi:hypothetical protein [Vibrio algicola]|uniref:Phage protein n=1 Tax=Vibrio algicola TaxID=2662262 RepID=A0A5Q0TFT2_9VIBR|nr:hypothetical protein [Vibrio algicola]